MANRCSSQENTLTAGDDSDANRLPACNDRIASTALEDLDESAIAALIGFFQSLDKWDLEAKSNGKAM